MTTIQDRRKRIDALYASPPKDPNIIAMGPTEEEWGWFLRHNGYTWMEATSLWHGRPNHSPETYPPFQSVSEDFIKGWHNGKPVTHFIGIRDERQYHNAVRLFGKPDYEWPTASFRVVGECAPGDTVVFGTSAFVRPKKWAAL